MARVIYISGTIEGRSFAEVTTQRDEISAKLVDAGFAVCDPMRHKGKDLGSGRTKLDLANTDFDITEIIGRDENDVRDSDALLVLTGDKPSTGTWLEFGLAIYECQIPVVVIAPKLRAKMDEVGRIVDWTGGKATKVVSDGDEAVEFFRWMYCERFIVPYNS